MVRNQFCTNSPWILADLSFCVSLSSKDQAEMDPADMEDVEEVEEEETGEDENSKGWSLQGCYSTEVLYLKIIEFELNSRFVFIRMFRGNVLVKTPKYHYSDSLNSAGLCLILKPNRYLHYIILIHFILGFCSCTHYTINGSESSFIY